MFSKKASDSKPAKPGVSKVDLPPPPGKPASRAPSGVPSIISPDLKIEGNLFCDGDIQIDGMIDGDIQSNSLTIGETAIVKGTVRADLVRVSGKINGEIYADKVVLTKTAHVEGDVIHRDLSIENGAFLEGAVRRVDSESIPEAPKLKKKTSGDDA
jgi:cytoskeletal protein CcmA (bactofilin family)